MAIIKPPVVDVWANLAVGSPDIATPSYIDTGFPLISGVPVIPPRGYFNWLFNYVTNAVRYYCIAGFPAWDVAEASYTTGAAVKSTDGNYYVLLGTATTGTVPQADSANWFMIQWQNRPLKSAWTLATAVWQNAAGQLRTVITHPGFVEGKVLSWQEDWQTAAMLTAKTGVGNGAWAGLWRYSISGDAAGGQIIGGDAGQDLPTFSGPPGSPCGARASNVFLATNPAGTAMSIQEIETGGLVVLDDDTCIAMQFDLAILPSSAGSPQDDNFAGLVVGSMIGLPGTFGSNAPAGIGFLIGGGLTAWHIYLRAAGASGPTFVNTGLSPSSTVGQRFRIEYYGTNVSDTGGAKALVYIQGAAVGGSPITFNLTGAASIGPTVGRLIFRHADQASLTWMNVMTTDFRANTWPGSVAY